MTARASGGVLIAALLGLVSIQAPVCAGGAAAQAPAATRQVTDAAGRVVTLPARVTRVADAWHANNALVLMLGGGDKLVATTVQAQRQPWLERLYPRIDRVPAAFDARGDVNLETLIGARPDVILMAYGGSLPKWAATADAYHIPYVLMPNTSLAGLEETARLTGQVLGEKELRVAEDYIRYFDANLRRVTAVTASLEDAQRPKVLHTASAGILTVDGRESLIDDWIRIAGGVNCAQVSGLGRPVTMEQVAAWDPDVIIVGTAPNRENRRAILDDPRWRGIEALKDGKVFVNPSGAYLWDRHSAEAALQVLWAAKTLHPDLFRDLDIEKETKAFYVRYFHYALTDSEYRSIIDAVAP
ncbi:MAG TPA: ABC transporter substrate-binding protein [Steroidobacteraceae bacterium]|jgi:iron complex transport system substrate-binding protein|nr:ABC transporter substrate-binding protein [Steroidobacteraceae bacterium]